MDSVNQTSGPQIVLQPVMQPKLNVILIGVIVLLLILLGISFSQVLSLRREVGELKTTVVIPQPTPISTGISTGTVAPVPTGGTNEPLEIIGIIQKSDVEGGCWYIQPEVPECKDDNCPASVMGVPANYEPTNLPKELQKTGLKAKFKLEVQSDVVTICQLGPTVKILDYQIIK